MNYLFHEKLSKDQKAQKLRNEEAQVPLNRLPSRMPGHPAARHHQGAEGAAGAGRPAAPAPGEEVLRRVAQQHSGGAQLSGCGESPR